MVNGSWLKDHGSCLKAHDQYKIWREGLGLGGPRAKFLIGHEP